MIRKFLGLPTALMLVSAASIAVASPAQAQLSECASTRGDEIFATIESTPIFSCQIGDKIYSNFQAVSGASVLAAATTTFSFSIPDIAGKNHTLTVTPSGITNVFNTTAAPGGLYSFRYTMTVDPEGTNFFDQLRTGATFSNVGGNTWTKTLGTDAPVTIAPSPASANQLSDGGSSAASTFSGDVATAIFTSTLTVTGGSVQAITDSLTQRFGETSEVPGPLAILGAGAAFGFSRKIRRRIAADA